MALFDNFTLFGYKLTKDETVKLPSIDHEKDPTVEIIETNQIGGSVIYGQEMVTVPQGEVELIKTCRDMAASAEIEMALNEIRNEIFIFDVADKRALELSFPDDSELPVSIRKKISAEFEEVYRMMGFRDKGLDYFDSWYIDGRLYLHKVIDPANPKDGIRKLIKIDPIKIKRVREVPGKNKDGIIDLAKVKEYFIFSDANDPAKGQQYATAQRGLKIEVDAICHIDSGIGGSGVKKGFLHKALVPYNNLKMMEEALLIYRISRAPERRIIYVDVGNLPKNKAEQYVRDLISWCMIAKQDRSQTRKMS